MIIHSNGDYFEGDFSSNKPVKGKLEEKKIVYIGYF
jgi:hypothetical protein